MDISSRVQIPQGISGKLLDQKVDVAKRFAVSGNAVKPGRDLKSTSKDFESILVFKMLESMRSSIPKASLIKSHSMDTYQSMLDQEMANEMAKGKGVGLADMIFKQVSKLEEKKTQADSNKASDTNSGKKNIVSVELSGE